MMFFSATYNQKVMEFAQTIVKNPIIIRLKREEESLDNIQQYYVNCGSTIAKYNALTNIYGTVGVGQAIIFCQVGVFVLHKIHEFGFFFDSETSLEILVVLMSFVKKL